MVKKSIKKEIIGYNNFARSLIIKEKQIIQDEEKKRKQNILFKNSSIFYKCNFYISSSN